MADDGRDLDPDVQAAVGYGDQRRSAQVLLLGLQERQQGCRRARLRPDARQCRCRYRGDLEGRGQGWQRQADLLTGTTEKAPMAPFLLPISSGLSPPDEMD